MMYRACLAALLSIYIYPAAGMAQESSDTLNIALVRLQNVSGYRGPWLVDRHLTKLLAGAIGSLSGVELIHPSQVAPAAREIIHMSEDVGDPAKIAAVARAAGADIGIGGTIHTFKLEGQGATSYRMGGYERFVAEVTLCLTVVDARSKAVIMDRQKIIGHITDNDAGVSFFNGPGDKSTADIMNAIWNAPIDSDVVERSVMGRAMAQVVGEACSFFSRATSGLAAGKEGRVVKVRGRDVYVNIGTEDDVRVGDILMVWPNVEIVRDPATSATLGFTRTGAAVEIEVDEVRGKRLSICRTSTADSIRDGDIVRLMAGERDGKWVGSRSR